MSTISKITHDSADFPEKLLTIPTPPKQLYVRGSLQVNRPLVAVVGSRKATSYGKQATELIVKDLVRTGIGIVSGLALGIDAYAHTMALEQGGYTVAVLGNGVDTIQPASNHNLGLRILKQHGAIISEYPNGTPALAHQFLERNRIVSGLADAVVIVEAAKRSGTLNTARHALEQNREVCAVPGLITSPMSEGTNSLLKAGAHPVTCARDILNILDLQPAVPKEVRRPHFTDTDQAILFELLISGSTNDGAILQEKSGLSADKFQNALTMLEIEGHIRALGNNNWSIRS